MDSIIVVSPDTIEHIFEDGDIKTSRLVKKGFQSAIGLGGFFEATVGIFRMVSKNGSVLLGYGTVGYEDLYKMAKHEGNVANGKKVTSEASLPTVLPNVIFHIRCTILAVDVTSRRVSCYYLRMELKNGRIAVVLVAALFCMPVVLSTIVTSKGLTVVCMDMHVSLAVISITIVEDYLRAAVQKIGRLVRASFCLNFIVVGHNN